MAQDARSPRRAHILASINPHSGPSVQRETRQPSPAPHIDETAVHDENPTPPDEADHLAPRGSRFRFKSKSSKRRRHDSRSHPSTDEHDSARSSRRHRHHRHKRRRPDAASAGTSPPPSGDTAAGQAEKEEEDPFAPAPLDADAAFRASLFDAMADDEGAAYWEGVYGQPLHVYATDRTAARGELERMTDDEYAAHVRQRMWEKTHAGVLEARERRARERDAAAQRAQAAARADREQRRAERAADEADRRRHDDGRRAERRRRWAEYAAGWAAWDGAADGMPWPALAGGRAAAAADDEAVRAFFVLGLDLQELGGRAFAARLRDERVRWHPDKMQQRLGPAMDEALMRDVTRIFQIIDKLWNDTRPET